jgi:hypothetical protein
VHALAAAMTALCGAAAAGQTAPRAIIGCLPLTIDDAKSFRPPTFADFRVTERFSGRSAAVDLSSHRLARQYRTRLRQTAALGPNFAGHYTIATWGCGSGCAQFAIIDARSGRVFFPPEVLHVSMLHVMEPEDSSHRQLERPRFTIDSNLLIVVGAVNEGADEGIAYYRWTGTRLELLRFIRSEKTDCGRR